MLRANPDVESGFKELINAEGTIPYNAPEPLAAVALSTIGIRLSCNDAFG